MFICPDTAKIERIKVGRNPSSAMIYLCFNNISQVNNG